LDGRLRVSWRELLDGVAGELNPVHASMFPKFPIDYYGSVYQSEWATDLLFERCEALAKLYPRLVRHGVTAFSSPGVLRFLGHKTTATGHVPPGFQGEVLTSLKRRPEGVRIKHSVKGNSIKVYDKQGSVLRVETTIEKNRGFKVFGRKEGDPEGERSWRCLRQGIADLHRRAQVSQAANGRYLDALAAVTDDASLGELAQAVCRPVTRRGQRVRALNPFAPDDAARLRAINAGEFKIDGLRNRDLRRLLFPPPAAKPAEERRRSGIVTRKLALLRAHALIKKVSHTHRYVLTAQGYRVLAALLAAQQASVTHSCKGLRKKRFHENNT
jgi:hypothetical protein